jgi:2-C-methyl-D-erythritol 4-phosphate cytidylyltransferase
MMDKRKRAAAIIVVAGEGVRMGTGEKKQYMILGNRPVLAHALAAFEKSDSIEELFVVIPEGDHDFCQENIIAPLALRKEIHLVSGGPTRQDSVFNGLKATGGRFDLVAIHDGVRPLVSVEQITQCVRVAEKYGGCIPAIRATDTIKTVDEEDRVVATMRRHMIRMAQTPQVFHYHLIWGAHLAAHKDNYVGTDDAELVERCGEVVKVIAGDPRNIKITVPEDLKVAEALLDYNRA